MLHASQECQEGRAPRALAISHRHQAHPCEQLAFRGSDQRLASSPLSLLGCALQKRSLESDPARLAQAEGGGAPPAARGTGALGPAQQALVAAADTFFIASSSGPPPGGGSSSQQPGSNLPAVAEAYGFDISHRGGPPGFVQASAGKGGWLCEQLD